MILAFAKRGDIIVADPSINFAIQKDLQISRFTVRWFDYNDLKSLEEVLLGVERERRKRRGPLRRRITVFEGIFEKYGSMVDLPKLVSCARSVTVRSLSDRVLLIELKLKYKYRLILDESISGTVG